ncbi:hypothetical protein ACSBR2_014120 [Camellia fascicularis]
MANDGQRQKVGDNTLTGSGKPIDLDIEGDNCNEETRDKNHGGKDNNVMQPLFSLQDTPIPAANAQKEGQKTVPIVPQHTRSEKHSHRLSREVGRGESRMEETRRTHRTKKADPREHRHVQRQELCFDATNGERSKRAHNEAESSAPKRLKSGDS